MGIVERLGVVVDFVLSADIVASFWIGEGGMANEKIIRKDYLFYLWTLAGWECLCCRYGYLLSKMRKEEFTIMNKFLTEHQMIVIEAEILSRLTVGLDFQEKISNMTDKELFEAVDGFEVKVVRKGKMKLNKLKIIGEMKIAICSKCKMIQDWEEAKKKGKCVARNCGSKDFYTIKMGVE